MNRFARMINKITRGRLFGGIVKPGLERKPSLPTYIENRVTIYYAPGTTQLLPSLDMMEKLTKYNVFFERRSGFTTTTQAKRIIPVDKMPPEDVINTANTFGITFQVRRILTHPE